MARRRDNVNSTLILGAIVVSALLHVVLWPVGNRVLRSSWSPAAPRTGSVMEVTYLPSADETEEPAERQPEPPQPVASDIEFAQLDRVQDEREPPPTKRRAEFDNRVDKETRAPHQRPVAGSAERAAVRPQDTQAERKPEQSQTPNARSLDLSARGRADTDRGQAVDGGKLAELARGKDAPKGDVSQGSAAPSGGMRGTSKALQKTFGRAGTFDALEDLDVADGNVFNTKRNKYASFFNRVRNGISQHWEPARAHRAVDPEGRVFGAKTRRTHLVIRLNPDGTLSRILLAGSSEAPHLDEEAIRAVRQAVPFFNPPAGLVDPDTGFIEFGFGFIFELRGKTRIFRYQH